MKALQHTRPDRRSGMALFSVMCAIGGLAIIGAMAFALTRTDTAITTNHRYEANAFANADAGIQYVKVQIEEGLAAGTVPNLTTSKASSVSVNISAPPGFNFDTVTSLTRNANGTWYCTVKGRDSNAVATIVTSWKQKRKMESAYWGCDTAVIQANSYVWSYYSSRYASTYKPTISDSTGEGDVGSNEQITTYNGTIIDGNVLLGQSSGVSASWTDPSGGSIMNGGVETIGSVDCDPLGMIGGDLADDFSDAKSTNNNDTVSTYINNQGELYVPQNTTVTMGSGSYYFKGITLNQGSILNISPTNGPVNFYVTGRINFNQASGVNNSGRPTDFSIYCSVGPSGNNDINLMQNGDFSGLIYAPYADVQIKNSGNFYGAVWCETVTGNNSGTFFADQDLLNRYTINKVKIATWKQDRGI